MMNIVILRESDIKPNNGWFHSIKNREDWMRANIVILLKNDGTYQPVKNRYGSPDLIGEIGKSLDLTLLENVKD